MTLADSVMLDGMVIPNNFGSSIFFIRENTDSKPTARKVRSMTEEKRESKGWRGINPSSKFWRTLLVILAAFLTFAGPTYLVYALANVLEINYAVSMISGLVLFMIGLGLTLYLIRNKVIS